MGLPGSGKTTLAGALSKELTRRKKSSCRLNADSIRQIHQDWDFSVEGRIRQSKRMARLANTCTTDFVIVDFIAPLPEMRDNFAAHYMIWMDTVRESVYKDTNQMFVPPDNFSLVIRWKDEGYWSEFIADILCDK